MFFSRSSDRARRAFCGRVRPRRRTRQRLGSLQLGPLVLEPLEPRNLLTVTASFALGVLTFTSDGASDTVAIGSTADITDNTIDYDIGGGPVAQSTVTKVVFDGGLGSDVLSISALSTAINLTISTVDSDFELQAALSATGSIDIDGADDVTIGDDLSATGSISIRAGNDGSGQLTFTPAPNLDAPTIALWAGIGDGTLAAAAVDVTNGTFRGAAGAGTSPSTFTLRQDADIADTDIPAASQFDSTLLFPYTIQSDGGFVTLATVGKVAGSDLTLRAKNDINTPAALSVNSLDILVDVGDIVLGGSLTTSGNQLYAGPVTLGAATTTLSAVGSTITFDDTLDGASDLTITADATTFSGLVGSLTPLTSLTVNGDAAIDGGGVETSTFQLYAGPVTLGAATTTLSAVGSTITFDDTLDGASDLTITADATTFSGLVGDFTPLTSLTVNGDAAIDGGGVETSTFQLYAGPVTLVRRHHHAQRRGQHDHVRRHARRCQRPDHHRRRDYVFRTGRQPRRRSPP